MRSYHRGQPYDYKKLSNNLLESFFNTHYQKDKLKFIL